MDVSPDRLLELRSSTSRKRNSRPATPGKGRWTPQEHQDFLVGLQRHGRDWKAVSEVVKTRTHTQTRTHHQKYDQQMRKGKPFPGEAYDLSDSVAVGSTAPTSCTTTTTAHFDSEPTVPPVPPSSSSSSSSSSDTAITTPAAVLDRSPSSTSFRATRQLFPPAAPVTSSVRGKRLASLKLGRANGVGGRAGGAGGVRPRSTRSSVAAAAAALTTKASAVRSAEARSTSNRGDGDVNGVDDSHADSNRREKGGGGEGSGEGSDEGGGTIADAGRWPSGGRPGKRIKVSPPVWDSSASSPVVGIAPRCDQQQQQQQQQRWSLSSPSSASTSSRPAAAVAATVSPWAGSLACRSSDKVSYGAHVVDATVGGQDGDVGGGGVGATFRYPPHLCAGDYRHHHQRHKQGYADRAAGVASPAPACARHTTPHPGAVRFENAVGNTTTTITITTTTTTTPNTATIVRPGSYFDTHNTNFFRGAGCSSGTDVGSCEGSSLVPPLNGHTAGREGCDKGNGGRRPPPSGGDGSTKSFISTHRVSDCGSGVWRDGWQAGDVQDLCGLFPAVFDRKESAGSGDGGVATAAAAVAAEGGSGARAAPSSVGLEQPKRPSDQAVVISVEHQQQQLQQQQRQQLERHVDHRSRHLNNEDAAELTAAAVAAASPSSENSNKNRPPPSSSPAAVDGGEVDGSSGGGQEERNGLVIDVDSRSDGGMASGGGLVGDDWTGIETFTGFEKFDVLAVFAFEDHFGTL